MFHSAWPHHNTIARGQGPDFSASHSPSITGQGTIPPRSAPSETSQAAESYEPQHPVQFPSGHLSPLSPSPLRPTRASHPLPLLPFRYCPQLCGGLLHTSTTSPTNQCEEGTAWRPSHATGLLGWVWGWQVDQREWGKLQACPQGSADLESMADVARGNKRSQSSHGRATSSPALHLP